MTPPLGLYLHIPFCLRRCDFCAFYLELYRNVAADEFVNALKQEIRLHASADGVAGRAFHTVYFGGGTPTVFKAGLLVEILRDLRQTIPLTRDCEITMEAHPGTVTHSYLSDLYDAGITRISFGAESMEDDDLARIGRPGAVRQTIAAVQAARETGFSNINLDLMYGLPRQSVEGWKQTLSRCVELGPEHLSCYALTVEEGTRLSRDIRDLRAEAPDESLQIAMDQTAQELLAEAGYQQYEISNYAKPGYACRHNLLYWTDGDYLGLGPSAQSFVEGVRFGKTANLTAYQSALAHGQLPIEESKPLTEEERLRDAVIFGLRLVQGVPTRQLREHAANFGHRKTLADLKGKRLIEEDGERSRLSAQGRLHADTIAEQLY